LRSRPRPKVEFQNGEVHQRIEIDGNGERYMGKHLKPYFSLEGHFCFILYLANLDSTYDTYDMISDGLEGQCRDHPHSSLGSRE
jgi:hypothetical protein